jgi:hypothetical protein
LFAKSRAANQLHIQLRWDFVACAQVVAIALKHTNLNVNGGAGIVVHAQCCQGDIDGNTGLQKNLPA